MMLFGRKLETHALSVNLASLKANLGRLQKEAYRCATQSAVRTVNGVLWRLNRPLTQLNCWFAHHGEALRCGRKAQTEQTSLDESIHRMVAEGGPALAES